MFQTDIIHFLVGRRYLFLHSRFSFFALSVYQFCLFLHSQLAGDISFCTLGSLFFALSVYQFCLFLHSQLTGDISFCTLGSLFLHFQCISFVSFCILSWPEISLFALSVLFFFALSVYQFCLFLHSHLAGDISFCTLGSLFFAL